MADLDTAAMPPDCVTCASRRFGVCASLPVSTLRRFKFSARPVIRHGEQRIVADGDAALNLLVIRQGTVRLVKRREDGLRAVIDFIGPGEIIDPIAGMTHTVEADAIETTKMMSVPRSVIRELTVGEPALRKAIVDAGRTFAARLEARLLSLGRASAKERLAEFLLGRARRHEQMFGPAGMASFDIAMPMKRVDIADHLGLRAETISRLTAELCSEGIIDHVGADRLRILDIGRLAAAAKS